MMLKLENSTKSLWVTSEQLKEAPTDFGYNGRKDDDDDNYDNGDGDNDDDSDI